MAIYLSCGKQAGLEGIATDALVKDKGASACSSFQFGVGLGVSISKGGVQKSDPSLSEIVVTKTFDAMSPALFINSCLGTTITAVTVDFTGTAGDAANSSVIYLTYELTNAIITGHSVSSGGDLPSESISIAYEAIVMTYNTPPKTAKNKDGSPVVQKFSVIENKKS
ncbi:MAG: type VI secretion system tube protein Hcp [Gemmatimonadaceae bacterium]|nr:type VI secretion system tube protein Hcp [Gemmatimonadaceae bacterium]